MQAHDKVRLTKDGLFGERWSKKFKDYVVDGFRAGGTKKGEFFWRNRNIDITVDEGVTLLHLVKAMADMNTDELHALCLLSNANLAPYLIDFCDHPEPMEDADKFGKLTAIEVYKTIEFDNHGSGDDVFDVTISTCAHGKGEIWEDCMDQVRAGTKKLDEVKECNSYAIEFTPWQKMLDIPIKIRPLIYHTEMVWKPCKPKEWKIGVLGSKKKHSMGKITREIVERKSDKKVKGPMSLGEFFTGLFNELAFFGTPNSRKEQHDIINDRVEDVEKQLEKEKKQKKK